MDEDEEVDIIGDIHSEQEISNLSSGYLLSCEYTVHPRWLTDGREMLPDGIPTHKSNSDTIEMVPDEVIIDEPSPLEIDIDDNTSDIILEENIPAYIEEEVIAEFDGDRYKDFDHYQNNDAAAIIDEESSDGNSLTELDTEMAIKNVKDKSSIPKISNAGFEPRSLLKTNQYKRTLPNPRSLLKSSFERPPTKFKQTLTINRESLLKINNLNLAAIRKPALPEDVVKLKKASLNRESHMNEVKQKEIKHKKPKPVVKSKFRQVVKIPNGNVLNRSISEILTTWKKSKQSAIKKKPTSGKEKSSSVRRKYNKNNKKAVDINGVNITIRHGDLQDDSLASKFSSGDIIKLQHDKDSDLEINIESDDDLPSVREEISKISVTPNKFPTPAQEFPKHEIIKPEPVKELLVPLELCDNELIEILSNMDEPTEELRINLFEISKLEKHIHYEFFDGRPSKTADRYLKIRNHILTSWRNNKPTYVGKTSVRNGLKQCGDVNCISRIHSLLEQIGAINFGCQGEHFEYIRPLSKLVESFKVVKASSKTNSMLLEQRSLDRKNRIKKEFPMFMEKKLLSTNITLSHSDGIPRIVSNKTDEKIKAKPNKKVTPSEFQQLHLLQFGDHDAPFRVAISVSTILCLQLHCNSSNNEVMGFLGGQCDGNVIQISTYKPCRTSLQSSMTCEMCPVSQVEQSNSLAVSGLDLVGWFHTHPTFSPHPSRRDVQSQATMQGQFRHRDDVPFVGLIMSGLDMSFKCMYILPKDLVRKDDLTPHEITVSPIFDRDEFIESIQQDLLEVLEFTDYKKEEYIEVIQKLMDDAKEMLPKELHSSLNLNNCM